MHNHRNKTRARKANKDIDPITGLYPYENYECSSYDLTYSRSYTNCFSHYVNAKAIYNLVLDTIKLVSEYAISNKAAFTEKVKEASRVKQLEEAKDTKKNEREENVVKGKDLIEKEIKKIGMTHSELVKTDYLQAAF